MPNWASMLYGTSPAFHGFTHNTTEPSFPQAVVDEYGYYPNIFALIHNKIPECRIAAFSEYGDIIKIVPPEVLARAEKISGVEKVLDYIESLDPACPSFTFVQFDEADGAGHQWGHNSPEYYKTLTRIDASVGQIREQARSRGLTDSATFILTADHGGFFLALNKDYMGIIFQHGGNTLEERQIPLIFTGEGIKKGPITGAVRIFDISPSVAALFDIPVPHVWLGSPVLQAFE
jgi:membrane-anchored protein YejM (alkaline phosphatase superfamily)